MTKSKKATESKKNAPALRVLETTEIVTVSGGDAAPAPTTTTSTSGTKQKAWLCSNF